MFYLFLLRHYGEVGAFSFYTFLAKVTLIFLKSIMSQTPDDKKIDLSSLPRGAISSKGLPVGKNARLPSSRPVRDLMLGAPKSSQPKRVFQPNIPVRRKNDQDKRPTSNEASTSVQLSIKPEFKKKDPIREKKKPIIVQTTGAVFGEGIAPAAAKESAARDSSVSYAARGERKSTKQSILKSDIYHTHTSSEDELDEEERIKKMSLSEMPAAFPRNDSILKEDPDKKPEDLDYESVENIARFIKKEEGISDTGIPDELAKIFGNDPSSMFLLQFPKSLSNVINNPESNEQGRIGKLQVLKSGRVRCVIGGAHFYLDSSRPLMGKHALASIENGHMFMLGNANKKHLFVPDIQRYMDKS